MAMGKRKRTRQPSMWGGHDNLPTASHPFYLRLNQFMREQAFDGFAEPQCAPFLRRHDGPPEHSCDAPAVASRPVGGKSGIARRLLSSKRRRLFAAQSLHRANPRRTAYRDVARHQPDRHEHGGHGDDQKHDKQTIG
jgi:hypothetical protein